MDTILEIRVDSKRAIPYLLDALLEIGIGIVLSIIGNSNSKLLWLGVFLTIFGVVQLIRKIKTFHLSKSHLLVKRPLMPFKFAETSFEIGKIKKIEFKRLVRVGPYLRIIGKINGKDGGFMLTMDGNAIDNLERELKRLDVDVTRENI